MSIPTSRQATAPRISTNQRENLIDRDIPGENNSAGSVLLTNDSSRECFASLRLCVRSSLLSVRSTNAASEAKRLWTKRGSHAKPQRRKAEKRKTGNLIDHVIRGQNNESVPYGLQLHLIAPWPDQRAAVQGQGHRAIKIRVRLPVQILHIDDHRLRDRDLDRPVDRLECPVKRKAMRHNHDRRD
jgi:hypothetical protein